MLVKSCADCDENPRAPGKAKCVGCLDAADWFDRERRRKRAELEDCKTCVYRHGDRCAYFPPREGKQPLLPGRCNFWLPVASADPNPDEEDDEHDYDEDDEYPDPAEDDVSHDLSVDGAAAEARKYHDDEYEEYDGYRPARG